MRYIHTFAFMLSYMLTMSGESEYVSQEVSSRHRTRGSFDTYKPRINQDTGGSKVRYRSAASLEKKKTAWSGHRDPTRHRDNSVRLAQTKNGGKGALNKKNKTKGERIK